MEFVIVLVVLAVVVFVVTGPLRRTVAAPGTAAAQDETAVEEGETGIELAELEAAREAKYREIRDAELDHATGKLSDADFEAVNSGLRAEAVEILRKIDALRGVEEPEADGGSAPTRER